MNLIQIYDMDGQEFGLFIHEQDKDLQPLVDKCQMKAENIFASGYGDDLTDVFLEELENEGFQRVFVVQELTTNIL